MMVLQSVVAISIFNLANILQADDPTFRNYWKEEIKQLAAFYGEEAEIEFHGESFQFPPVIGRGCTSFLRVCI